MHTAINICSFLLFVSGANNFRLATVSFASWLKTGYNKDRPLATDAMRRFDWAAVLHVGLPVLLSILFLTQLWTTWVLLRMSRRAVAEECCESCRHGKDTPAQSESVQNHMMFGLEQPSRTLDVLVCQEKISEADFLLQLNVFNALGVSQPRLCDSRSVAVRMAQEARLEDEGELLFGGPHIPPRVSHIRIQYPADDLNSLDLFCFRAVPLACRQRWMSSRSLGRNNE